MAGSNEFLQNRLNTEAFWTNLSQTVNTEDLLSLTEDQIEIAEKNKLLSEDDKKKLIDTRSERIVAIRTESVTRYPVQVPKESALQTYSDKYEEKMTESKREKKLNRFGTTLHRKKLNAENIENAESKHKDEKNSLIAKVMNTVQNRPAMSGSDISDWAEFLEDNKKKMDDNVTILTGEKFEDRVKLCVSQFNKLDLSADLRTDKKLANDAKRLEKVAGQARAMINLVDRYPEIKENMPPKEREEFEGKLDRAFTFVDYYGLRKDIITDKWYRTHENSEISTRFEPVTPHEQANPEEEQRHLEKHNLTRKIWTAENRAASMSQYSSRSRLNLDVFPKNIISDAKQADENDYATTWRQMLTAYFQMNRTSDAGANVGNGTEGDDVPLPKHTFKDDAKGAYLSEHYKRNDPVYQAVTATERRLAGTNERIEDFDRNYANFAEWKGLNNLSLDEFNDMMNDFTAFNETVNADTRAETVTNLQNRELSALGIYKKAIQGEIPHLKEKYGMGVLMETPTTIQNRYKEILKDVGNTQTITDMMEVFRNHGMLNDNDPADQEMEATMWYMHSAVAAVLTTYSLLSMGPKTGYKFPSYADTMRYNITFYEQSLKDVPPSVVLRIRDLERNPDMKLKVKWEGDEPVDLDDKDSDSDIIDLDNLYND